MTTAAAGAIGVYRVQRGTAATRVATAVGLLLFAGFLSLPAWGSSGTMKLMVEFLTLLAIAQMWNLLAGFAGLVSIGQQAFIGLGAYGLYVFMDLVHLPPVAAIVALAVAIAAIAYGTSFLAFRLRGGFFAIGTWVIAEVFRLVIGQVGVLGAGSGATVKSLVGMAPADRLALTYWLAVLVGFGSIAACVLVVRSRLGLALRAVRDGEVSAGSLGIDVATTKRIVYVIAGVGAAIAGAVYYLQLLRIQPTAAFSVEWTVVMIFMVVIGGLGSIEGPILGAIVFFILQETLADYGSAYLVTLGVVAILVVLVSPKGIWGWINARRPISLFAVQRRLVPVAAPTDGSTPANEPTEEPTA
jgi:branched-chain amino acid transport system permease protein